MKASTARQLRLAAAYDAEIWPLVPARAAELILRHLPRRASARVLEIGSATGKLALDIAEKLDGASRVLGIEASPAFVERAEAARGSHAAGSRVSFRLAEDLAPPWPTDERAYDLAVANLVLADLPDPARAAAELARTVRPGGRLLATVAVRGSWAEFLDLYRDVLTEQDKPAALAALQAHLASWPDPASAISWLEAAGLQQVTIELGRWELLFKSAREFFFAPIIELGPLPVWKRIAGGRGDEMQDVFFFAKEAIEKYFSGTVFPVSMVVACLQGTRPLAPTR